MDIYTQKPEESDEFKSDFLAVLVEVGLDEFVDLAPNGYEGLIIIVKNYMVYEWDKRAFLISLMCS